MHRPAVLTVFFFLLFTALSVTQAQTIPTTKAKALDDSDVTFPKPSDQQVIIYIVGFSKKSGDACQAWSKRISTALVQDPRVNYYQIPQLEGVHSVLKPVILHGMRSGLSPLQLSRVVPLYDHLDEWKQLVNFSAPDDPYLILTTPEGHIVWQAHGPISDATYADLKHAVTAQLKKL